MLQCAPTSLELPAPSEVDPGQPQRAGKEMNVRIVESRQNQPPIKVKDSGRWPDQRSHLLIFANQHDLFALDRQCFGK
jgi:hypothetical protein